MLRVLQSQTPTSASIATISDSAKPPSAALEAAVAEASAWATSSGSMPSWKASVRSAMVPEVGLHNFYCTYTQIWLVALNTLRSPRSFPGFRWIAPKDLA